ncbi:hypothetical protein F5Y17DRAFT_417834 [Xylariaceae sp. FL0594]|nr:hypothetical protein F5Y17DRAFT_417834 [Xylariaceae sp. FL0594]
MPDWPKWKAVPGFFSSDGSLNSDNTSANTDYEKEDGMYRASSPPGARGGRRPAASPTSRAFLLLALISTIGSVVSIYVISQLLSSAQKLTFPSYLDTQAVTYDCGGSSGEAIAKGCVFDELLLAWVPSQCPRRQETKFMDYMNWTWPMYEDLEGTRPLDRHQLSRWDGKEYYTTQREHSGHCMFIMLRFFDSVRYGNRVDSMAMHHPHARHCTQFILELLEQTKDRDKLFGPFTIEYESC